MAPDCRAAAPTCLYDDDDFDDDDDGDEDCRAAALRQTTTTTATTMTTTTNRYFRCVGMHPLVHAFPYRIPMQTLMGIPT